MQKSSKKGKMKSYNKPSIQDLSDKKKKDRDIKKLREVKRMYFSED